MMNLLYLILSVLVSCTHGASLQRKPYIDLLFSIYNWKLLEFDFPTDQARQQSKASGNLKPTNAIPMDVQPTYNKDGRRIFVTIPKLADGIPYSLATISENSSTNGPLLEPYPNFEAHSIGNGPKCDVIMSAFHMAITECNQMWVIDSGSFGLDTQCPPQLLLFDLVTDELIYVYRYDPSLYIPEASAFVSLVVNVLDPPPKGTCSNTMVYVTDVSRSGLVVYDYKNNDAWRIENLFMYPNINYGEISVAGESFAIDDGIFGMAADKTRLYFHPLASVTEYSVPLNVINDGSLFKKNSGNFLEKFRPLGERKSPCTVSAMDRYKNLYCVTTDPISLIVWNVDTPYYSQNVIESTKISKHLQFVSGMKVVKNNVGNEELWMISNKYQKSALDSRNYNETNFDILVLPLVDDVRISRVLKD